jgi:hypothetical protein
MGPPHLRNRSGITQKIPVKRDHKQSPPDETPAKNPETSDGDGGSTSDDEASTSGDSDSADGSDIETSDDEASAISNSGPMKVIYKFTEDKAVDGAKVMKKTQKDFAEIIQSEGLDIEFMHIAWEPEERQLIAVFYGPGALALSNINPKNLKKHKSVAFDEYDVVRVLAWKWLEADLTPGSLMVTNCL